MEIGAIGPTGAIARYLVEMEPLGEVASAITHLHNLKGNFAWGTIMKHKLSTTFLVPVSIYHTIKRINIIF